MEASAAVTGASARRIAPGLSAMIVTAEGTRTDTALTAGFGVSPSRLRVSVKRPGDSSGAVVNSATSANIPRAGVHAAAETIRSTSVEIAPVIECSTP